MAKPELVDEAVQSLQAAAKSFLAELQSLSLTRKGERGHGRDEHLRRLVNNWYELAVDS